MLRTEEKTPKKHGKEPKKHRKHSIIDAAPVENPLLEPIRMFFYNTIGELALEATDISTNNIKQQIPDLIKQTICIILNYPRTEPNVVFLPGGTVITRDNCPNLYLPLFGALLNIKPLYQSGIGKTIPEHLDAKLTLIARRTAELPNFKDMLNSLCNFILETKGLELLPFETNEIPNDEKETAIDVEDIPLISLSTNDVDMNLIRQTFYKKMLVQTLAAEERGWITYDDLEGQDAYIYLALPALTLIDALHQSQPYVGICLLGKKMLVPDNCPEEDNFLELFQPIFKLKNLLKTLNDGELMLVKWLTLQNEQEIPAELTRYLNKKVTGCAGIFSSVATEISKRKLFQQMVPEVIDNCVDTLKSQQKLDTMLTMKMG